MNVTRKQARQNKAKAVAKFKAIAVLNTVIDGDDANARQEANKAKAKMAESWHNRNQRPGDAWKRKNSKPGAVVVTKA